MKPAPHRSSWIRTGFHGCSGLLCAYVLTAACSGANPTKDPSTPATDNRQEPGVLAAHELEPNYVFDQALPDCPMQVPETELTSVPVDGGLAFTFTTARSAEEVRVRASKLASEYARGRVQHVPPTRAEVVEVPGGARVEVRAVYEADVPRVRAHLRWRATKMQETRSCPLMRQGRNQQKETHP